MIRKFLTAILIMSGLFSAAVFIGMYFVDWDQEKTYEQSLIIDRVIDKEPKFEMLADELSDCDDTASYYAEYNRDRIERYNLLVDAITDQHLDDATIDWHSQRDFTSGCLYDTFHSDGSPTGVFWHYQADHCYRFSTWGSDLTRPEKS